MPDRPLILMLTTMHESGMGLLRHAAELRVAPALDPETLRREVRDVDALILRTAGVIDAPLLDCATKLQVIGRHGVGYDHVDVPAATQRGIHVVTTPGANTGAVAEHALAFMIAISKHFPQQTIALKEGRYNDRTKLVGRELFGRTLGIIGFGRIGRRVGQMAYQGFGMRVLYNDIVDPPPEAEEAAGWARRVALDELLRESEYVTLHVPLDSSTRRLIGGRQLALMRP